MRSPMNTDQGEGSSRRKIISLKPKHYVYSFGNFYSQIAIPFFAYVVNFWMNSASPTFSGELHLRKAAFSKNLIFHSSCFFRRANISQHTFSEEPLFQKVHYSTATIPFHCCTSYLPVSNYMIPIPVITVKVKLWNSYFFGKLQSL